MRKCPDCERTKMIHVLPSQRSLKWFKLKWDLQLRAVDAAVVVEISISFPKKVLFMRYTYWKYITTSVQTTYMGQMCLLTLFSSPCQTWTSVRLSRDYVLEETALTPWARTSANVPRVTGKVRPTRSAKVCHLLHKPKTCQKTAWSMIMISLMFITHNWKEKSCTWRFRWHCKLFKMLTCMKCWRQWFPIEYWLEIGWFGM